MRTRLLLITNLDLGIAWQGNIMRIRNLVIAFSRMQYDIVLICGGLSLHDPLQWLCTQVVRISEVPSWKGNIHDLLSATYVHAAAGISETFQPQIVIVEYAWMAKCLEVINCPCIKVIDTHDFFSEHTANYIRHGLRPWITCSSEEEKGLLEKADVIIAIQQNEQRKFQELLPGKRVICIPHLGEIVRASTGELPVKPTIGFVGSAHAGNFGILKFIRHCWPFIRQEEPSSTLVVAGSVGNLVTKSEDEHIQVRSYVADISSFYHSLTMVICPIQMGTGLKIKLVEALLHGKAVVATPTAVEGLPETGIAPYAVANEWQEFSQKILQLMRDATYRQHIEANALVYGEENFSFQAGIEKIKAIAE